MSETGRGIPSMLEDAVRLCDAREAYEEALAIQSVLADRRGGDPIVERLPDDKGAPP